MRYISWTLAVLGVCGVVGFSAYHFHDPRILLGLLAIWYFPNPYTTPDEAPPEDGQ